MTEFETKLPLKLVKLPQNRGLGKALNEGLLHCAYDWVFRMDTDDICVPERFEKQVAFIEQHPESIIFGGQIAEFGKNVNDIVAYRNVPTSAQEIIKFTQKRCPFNHMTVAYQKKVRSLIVVDMKIFKKIIICGSNLSHKVYIWRICQIF